LIVTVYVSPLITGLFAEFVYVTSKLVAVALEIDIESPSCGVVLVICGYGAD
jgi:hypothetical protein